MTEKDRGWNFGTFHPRSPDNEQYRGWIVPPEKWVDDISDWFWKRYFNPRMRSISIRKANEALRVEEKEKTGNFFGIQINHMVERTLLLFSSIDELKAYHEGKNTTLPYGTEEHSKDGVDVRKAVEVVLQKIEKHERDRKREIRSTLQIRNYRRKDWK